MNRAVAAKCFGPSRKLEKHCLNIHNLPFYGKTTKLESLVLMCLNLWEKESIDHMKTIYRQSSSVTLAFCTP